MSDPIYLSLKTATLATFIVSIMGTSIAFLLAEIRFKGKSIVEALFFLPMVLPPTVTGYYLVILLGRYGIIGKPIVEWTGWSIMFTWQAAVLASSVVSFPIMLRTAQSAIESVDREMIHSSVMLGYGRFETALRVVLPLAWRGIFAGIVLTFTRAIGEFGATIMLAGNIPGRTATMPLAIYAYATSGDWASAHKLVLALSLISVIFLFLSQNISRRSV